MLNQLFRRIAAALIGAAVAATAGAIAAVAAAFALYGLLRLWFGPAAAAGLDGAAFASVALIIALVLPSVLRRRPRRDADAGAGGWADSGVGKLASDALIALLTAGLEMVRSRRAAPKERPRERRGPKNRP
jgi:hypothetical protein